MQIEISPQTISTSVKRATIVGSTLTLWCLDFVTWPIIWTAKKTWRPAAKVLILLAFIVAVLERVVPGYIELRRDTLAFVDAKKVALARIYGFEPPASPERGLDYVGIVERAAVRHGFSQSYGRKVAYHESRFDPRAQSHSGARGLMQVMPANAKRCGVSADALWDPETNAECGFKLLRAAFDEYRDARKALLAYNGGSRAVEVVTRCGDNTKCMGGYVESYAYSRDILNDTATDMRG